MFSISNVDGLNTLSLHHNYQIIHKDQHIIILAVDAGVVSSAHDSFWCDSEKLLGLVVGEDVTEFTTKKWEHSHNVGNQSILKFWL